jgi:hypothetical protein
MSIGGAFNIIGSGPNGLFKTKPGGGAPSNTPRTQAFLTATGITDATIISALNAMDTSLISAGLLPSGTGAGKIKVLYPIVGGTAATHKFNFVDPQDTNAAFRLVFFGGITHNANGMTGSGTNGYANSFFNPDGLMNLNSLSIGFYSRTNVSNGSYDIGSFDSGSSPANCQVMIQARLSDFMFSAVNQDDPPAAPATTNSFGFHAVSRINSTQETKNIRGTNTTNNRTSKDIPNLNMFLMAVNFNGSPFGYSLRNYAYYYISDGLNTTELNSLNTLIVDFQTALGRQV